MSMRIICLITFLSLAFGMSVEGNQHIITVNYPPDKTIIEFGPLGISLTVPQGSASLIKVNVNDKEYMKIVPDQEVECFSVLLTVGINRINIAVIKEDKEVDNIAVSVFRRSDLTAEYIKPPAGYKIISFHEKNSGQCTGCHVLESGDSDRRPVNIAAFPSEILSAGAKAAAKTSTCYSCHKALTLYPFVHGPAAVWSCLSCHDPHASDSAKFWRLNVGSGFELCRKCHTD